MTSHTYGNNLAEREYRLTIFIPGKLDNPLNGSHGGWYKHARWAKTQLEKAELCILHELGRYGPVSALNRVPKRVTFHAYVWSLFDDDNLRACLKPHRDALVSMRVLHSDGPTSGHQFVYEQVISRGRNARRGVTITVEGR